MLMKATRKALNELGEKTGKRYTLSIAGYAGTNFVNTVEPVELMKYLDFINIMTYDYHGAWDEYAAFNAPMYANENDPTPMAAQCITASVKSYVDAGFPADKIVLGAPFYGRGFVVESADNNGTFQKGKAPAGTGKGKGTWEAAVFDCWEVEEKYLGEWGFTRYWDDVAKCPVAFDGELWICYEDAESIKVKTDYIKEENLGGIMFWEFFGDKYKTLQTVAAEELSINK